MATYSGILAWRIAWTEEPGSLQSIESQSQTRLKQLISHMSFIEHSFSISELLTFGA